MDGECDKKTLTGMELSLNGVINFPVHDCYQLTAEHSFITVFINLLNQIFLTTNKAHRFYTSRYRAWSDAI